MLLFSFWGLGILLIVIQTTLLPYLPPWVGQPDFIFILVAFAAYRFPWVQGIALVFSLGWIMDVIAGVHLGMYPLICLVVFAVLKSLTRRALVKEGTYQIPLVGISYFLIHMFHYFIYSLNLPETLPDWSWGETLRRTALVVLAALPLFVLFNSLYEALIRRQLRVRPPRRRVTKSIHR